MHMYVPGGPGSPLGPAGPSGPCGPATPVRPMCAEINTFMLMILMLALTTFWGDANPVVSMLHLYTGEI